ncbi:hypothetical protein [Buchnera aphidicola]|uniref:hypothetical protein n=1 Tax=Buchnera aphidicola TaxID=9 RepID=UPI0031B8512E
MNNSIKNNSILNTINCNKNIYNKNLNKKNLDNNIKNNFLNILLNKINNNNYDYSILKNNCTLNLNNFKNVKKLYNDENRIDTFKDDNETTDYSSLLHKTVMIETSEVILTNPIVVGVNIPKDAEDLRLVISDDNRNIIFSKDLGPACQGENIYSIDRNEIDKKYYSSNDIFPSVYNFTIVAKNQYEIVPSTCFSSAKIIGVIESHNNLLLNLGPLGLCPFTNMVKILK